MSNGISEYCRFLAEMIYTDNLVPRREVPPHRMISYKRKYRSELREQQKDDPLAVSFRDGRKLVRYSDDGESMTEYQMLPGEWTDEELDNLANEEWITINSPYDCTGHRFTWRIDFVRTPAGVVYIHGTGLDV